MAQQLHYTSAATGLAGRPGFQFVAASAAATAAMQQAVAPYLTYRPPPSAPSQPSPEQVAAFPVSYSYVPRGTTAILTQCRYLGTDYSGRYGNFLGHAVVAELPELDGRPPIALWRSPLWATAPATADPPLPELRTLPSGDGMDRASLAGWLATTGAYRRLAELVDAVLATLAGRAGQVILVAREVETVVRWIAALSYSLPLAWVQRLSFTTYTGDAARAPQHLVGTTTDAFTGAAGHARVFRLDQPEEPAADAGWYASALARAWRDHDAYRLDVLNDLVTGLAGDGDPIEDRDAAAALAELCRGERLDRASVGAVGDLLIRRYDRLPPWVWDDLASRITTGEETGLDFVLAVHRAARGGGRVALADQAGVAAVRLGIGEPRDRPRLAAVQLSADAAADLAGDVAAVLRTAADLNELRRVGEEARRLAVPLDPTALRAGAARAVLGGRGRVGDLLRALPPALHPEVLQGVVAGLAGAGPDRVAAALDDGVCDLLAGRVWTDAPQVGAHVLASVARRHPAQRQAATAALADLADQGLLADRELGRRLQEIWHAGPPHPTLCQRLLAPVTSAARARERGAVILARQALAAGNPTAPAAYHLAQELIRVLGRDLRDPAVADAFAVTVVHRAARGDLDAYADLSKVEGTAQPALVRRVVAALAAAQPAAFLDAGPLTQVEVLRRLPAGDLRRRLVAALIARVDRDPEAAGADLAHVAAELHHAGAPDRQLTARAARLVRRPGPRYRVESELARRDKRVLRRFHQMIADHDQASLLRRMTFRVRNRALRGGG